MCGCVYTCLLSYRLGETLLSEGLDLTPVPRFGVGSGPILLDDVSCTGKEPSILLCNKREWFRHDCTHHEDVNIACSPERNGESLPASKTESYLYVRPTYSFSQTFKHIYRNCGSVSQNSKCRQQRIKLFCQNSTNLSQNHDHSSQN